MPTDRTESLIHRIFEEAFNEGNMAIVDESFSPDHFTHTAFGGAPCGPGGKVADRHVSHCLPPIFTAPLKTKNSVVDRFAAHWTMRGTHRGLFLGNLPTGRPVEVQGLIFACTANGQIAEDWTLVDQIGILQQLGIVPPP